MNKLGIDLGSRYVKTALRTGTRVKFGMTDTAEFYRKYIRRENGVISIDTEKLELPPDYTITATGYGRNLMSFSNAEIITEIKAHFRGCASTMKTGDFILIDIGGQDSKVIFGKEGYVEDFVMNDKCAASTGRFAENACNVLGISLAELSEMYENPANMTTTCAVFCESEIIGMLASGVPTESIAAGINKSIAKRLLPLIKSFKSDNIFSAGGVAQNRSLVRFVSDMLGKEIITVGYPQFNGALGCLDFNGQEFEEV